MENKIKFGMPTLIEKPKIKECIALCMELELDFIEMNMNLPYYQIGNIDAKEMLKLSSDNNIFLTIHLDENLNVCDFNESVANAYLNTVLQSIDLAKRLNIPILNMHMAAGVYFTLPNRKVYLFDEYKDHYYKKLKQFRDLCTKAIGNTNIKICIENSGGYKDFMQAGVKILLESDVFALTWDIGHDHSNMNVDTLFMLENASSVIHMHIHDALGTKNHLVLGSGEINLTEKIMFAQEHNCSCVIETKSIDGLQKSVSFLKEHRIFNV
jgi:sugar phosphate isomerase/epimerase